ncbi:MAG TPA: SDR family oxidoreductase [Trebonia sp.]
MRHVVVTGGGTGIGLAVAAEFSEAGDQVTITGRREHVLKQAVAGLGERAAYACFDASDPAAVTAALPRLPGRVDVLVNNAGGNTDFGDSGGRPPGEQFGGSGDRPPGGQSDRDPVPSDDLAVLAAQWRSNLDANLLSAVLVTTALTPRFTEGTRIVSLSSIAARRGAASYGAAKAAVETWTADIAAELGPRGITANAVSPGLTEGSEFFRGTLTSQRRQRLIDETFVKRPGTTADVAALVAFLASPQAGHITGQVIHVNGGAYLGR